MDPVYVRKVANFTSISKENKFDKATFDAKKTLEEIPKKSPKLQTLLDNIKELDKKDEKEQGKLFKHFIFSEVKQGGFGAKVITSGLISYRYKLAYDKKINLLSDNELKQTKSNNFLLLCSTDVYGNNITVKKKKAILDKYNQRPENSYGDLARIIVLDGGFMEEGIKIFIKFIFLLCVLYVL